MDGRTQTGVPHPVDRQAAQGAAPVVLSGMGEAVRRDVSPGFGEPGQGIRQRVVMRHVAQSTEYGQRFPGWLALNWQIFECFENKAMRRIREGRKHLAAKQLFEEIRNDTSLRERDKTYKLNNNFTSDCARLFAHLHPEHAGKFAFRARTAV